MKMLKWALLGGAAFAVTATAAQADELSDLKAQLAALQTRVSQLEAQPSASLPSGYSLMSFRSGGAVYASAPEKADMRQLDAIDNGFSIGVMPAADVAPVAEVTVSGEIRTILVYNGQGDITNKTKYGYEDYYQGEGYGCNKGDTHSNYFCQGSIKNKIEDSQDQLDVQVRGRLVVTGKADTAVGEVGGKIRLQAGNPFDDNNSVDMNQAYAWWKFSPSWQLIAGLWDSTSAVQAGIDWDFTGPAFTGDLGDDGSTEQMRLVFNDGGPFTFAVALEDNESDDYCHGNSTTFTNCVSFSRNGFDTTYPYGGGKYHSRSGFGIAQVGKNAHSSDLGDIPAVAGYIAYDAEGVFLQVSGLWEQDKRKFNTFLTHHFTSGYTSQVYPYKYVNALQIGSQDANDNWFLGAGARFGLGDMATITAAAFYGEGYQDAVYTTIGPDDQYWGASLGLIANVGEASRLEIGAAYFKNDDAAWTYLDEQWSATAGWFWDPVSQVTVFVTGSYAWNDYKGGCFGVSHDSNGFYKDNCSDADVLYLKETDYSQDKWQALFGTTLRF